MRAAFGAASRPLHWSLPAGERWKTRGSAAWTAAGARAAKAAAHSRARRRGAALRNRGEAGRRKRPGAGSTGPRGGCVGFMMLLGGIDWAGRKIFKKIFRDFRIDDAGC